MTVFTRLREHARTSGDPPHALARTLAEYLSREISAQLVVSGFLRAFPSVPLEVLLKACQWSAVSAGEMTDAEFDALLGPYIARDLGEGCNQGQSLIQGGGEDGE